MKNVKKMVVTGGAGFIGSHIVDELFKRRFDVHVADVHVVDNLAAGKKENVNPRAVFHEADVRDYDALLDIFDGADVVFHQAALPRVEYSIKHPVETNEVNIGGTLNVLHAAKEAGVRRVVYAGSSSAYGDQEILPLVETMPTNPLSPYGLQKHVGELYARVWSAMHGLETVSLRYFNVYGPGMDPNGAYALVIAKFLKQRADRRPITITGDGEQTRDFTHIKDVVDANLRAAFSDRVGRGEIINIGAGRGVSVGRIAELIGGPVEYIPARLEPKHTAADNSLARKLLGWEPTITIEEGIEELKKQYIT
ncbi:NAD-dependent epimerase/dehydratase family protein [bacterium]|nr:NAD-dependent epimerase/dehydratase family protein [bacterium]